MKDDDIHSIIAAIYAATACHIDRVDKPDDFLARYYEMKKRLVARELDSEPSGA